MAKGRGSAVVMATRFGSFGGRKNVQKEKKRREEENEGEAPVDGDLQGGHVRRGARAGTSRVAGQTLRSCSCCRGVLCSAAAAAAVTG